MVTAPQHSPRRVFSRFWLRGRRRCGCRIRPITSPRTWASGSRPPSLSAALTGVQMYTRTRRIHSGMADEMIRMAVEQFLPSAGAGALITIVLVRYVASRVLWMLPGMWQVIFSLGVFSSCRFLAAADGCSGCVVSADGADLSRNGRHSGALSVGHGNSLRSGPVSGRGDSVLHARGE